MAGTGTVYWREAAGSWQVKVRIGGKWVYKSGFSTKAAGQRWMHEQTREAERAELLGLTPVRTDLRLSDVIPRWLTSIRPRVSETTYESYELTAKKILVPFFGDVPLVRIQRRDVEDFLAARAAAGLSPATLNRNLTALSQLFEFAVDMGFARASPVKGIRRGREEARSFMYLSEGDEARLLAAMPEWLRTPALVSLDAGLRAGEIEYLTPRDVDLYRGVIVVRRSKSRRPREVGMTRRLKEALTKHLAALEKDEELVFRARPSGRSFHRHLYRDAFAHATKAAGLHGFRWHDLRHCAGVRLAEAGATPATIKAVLGHRCLAATLRYMDHAPLDAARTAARLLDARRDAESPPAAPAATGSEGL